MEITDVAFADHLSYLAFRPGVLINAGTSLDNEGLIKHGVDSLATLLNEREIELKQWLRPLFYNLGTGYTELLSREKRRGVSPDNPLYQQTKNAYWRAIKSDPQMPYLNLQPQLYCNYGNALADCGRHYEALIAYDEAIRANPRHSMSIGNKGIELARYAFLAKNQSGLLLAEAFELCWHAANDQSLITQGLVEAQSVFKVHADSLASIHSEWQGRLEVVRSRALRNPLRSKEEQLHRDFALKHGLYLNLCVHSWQCIEQDQDTLFFGYVTLLEDPHVFDRLARRFNQMKEDFATARYLLLHAVHATPRRNRISSRTQYADLLEYADYGLEQGLLKASYSTAYNILDKIAVFLKWELELPENERDVTFQRVWHSGKEKNLRFEVRQKGDPNLFALFDIALQLRHPAFKHLSQLRHAITHRHLVTHDWLFMVGAHSSKDEHVLKDDLVKAIVEILQLTKAALIYLAVYLSQEQERRATETRGSLAPLSIQWQVDPPS